jgi:hypothetical protein
MPADASDITGCGGDLQTTCAGGRVCGNGSCFFFYDGFDGAMSPTWKVDVDPSATVAVDTNKAFRGTGSLAVTLSSTGTWELARLVRPMSLDPAFVRAFVWIPSTATMSTSNDVEMMTYRNSNDSPWPQAALTLRSTFRLGAAVDSWQATPNAVVASNAMPRDTWVCVEWSVQYDGTARVATSQSGAVVASVAPTALAVPLDSYAMGFNGPPPAAPFTFWIDELAIDGSPIGCDR